MLDENSALIKTISDYQNAGKHSETVQYQWTLHRNLVYLASVADSNQNLQNLANLGKGKDIIGSLFNNNAKQNTAR